MLTYLLSGFSAAFELSNVLAIIAGAVIGTTMGVLPGMAPTAVIAMLLPVVLRLSPQTGLLFLGAVYFGSQYGSSMSAILLNIPSEPQSIVIARDGFQLTKKGRAGPALAVAAIASFSGATFGLIGLALLAPLISQVALSFGPPEYFDIALFGALILTRLGGTSPWRGISAFAIGAMLSTIGQDPLLGTQRFTFHLVPLMQGITVVPIAIGLYGITEVIMLLSDVRAEVPLPKITLRNLWPSRQELQDSTPAIARGAIAGFAIGMLPGPALTLASFLSYRIEKFLDHGKSVGHGAMRAIAGPKAADDAAIGATLAPLLILGLPFTPVTAVLFAGMLLAGLQPGPAFISSHPSLFWGLVTGLLVTNGLLLMLNLPFVSIWVNLLRIPRKILASVMFVLMMIGAFALDNSWSGAIIALAAGGLGVVLKRYDFDRILVVLGVVLGAPLERYLRTSLILSRGSFLIFLTQPISLGILVALLVLLAAPPFWKRHQRHATMIGSGEQGGDS